MIQVHWCSHACFYVSHLNATKYNAFIKQNDEKWLFIVLRDYQACGQILFLFIFVVLLHVTLLIVIVHLGLALSVAYFS